MSFRGRRRRDPQKRQPRSLLLRGPLQSIAELGEHRAHFLDRPVERLAVDDERRRETDDRAMRILREDPAREQPIDDIACRETGALDLEPDEEAFAADVA